MLFESYKSLGCVYYREGDHSGDTYCFQEQGDFLSTCIAGQTFLVEQRFKFMLRPKPADEPLLWLHDNPPSLLRLLDQPSCAVHHPTSGAVLDPTTAFWSCDNPTSISVHQH